MKVITHCRIGHKVWKDTIQLIPTYLILLARQGDVEAKKEIENINNYNPALQQKKHQLTK